MQLNLVLVSVDGMLNHFFFKNISHIMLFIVIPTIVLFFFYIKSLEFLSVMM